MAHRNFLVSVLLAEGHGSPGPHRLTPAQAALPGGDPLSPPAACPSQRRSRPARTVLRPSFSLAFGWKLWTVRRQDGREEITLDSDCPAGPFPSLPGESQGPGAARGVPAVWPPAARWGQRTGDSGPGGLPLPTPHNLPLINQPRYLAGRGAGAAVPACRPRLIIMRILTGY